MNLSTINRRLLALWGVVLGFLFVLPRVAAAQGREVATGIPSCREYAQPSSEVVLTAPVELPQILAASWNGGTREQIDAYFNRQQPFPAPVLVSGLPTRLDRRGIGPRNWLHPGTDNAFRCEFQTGSSSSCVNARTNPQEGVFASLIDVLRVNPLNRIQVTGTVTEEFVRLETEALPPVSFPQSQTLRRSPNQAGVPAGSVRWIYTATANLTPNCQGRPTTPLFVNGIPTREGRAYLASPCTAPVNGTSLKTLFGWNPTVRYAGSTRSEQFKIRALPGRFLIPRSTAFQSVAEQACLALPRIPTAAQQLRCDVAPEQLTAWNQVLTPAATVPGLVANDLRDAARTTSTLLNTVLEGPKCADARAIEEAQRVARLTEGQRDTEARQKRAAQAMSRFRGQVIVGLVVGLLASLLVIAWLLVTRSQQKTIEIARTHLDQERETEDASVGAEIGLIFEIAKKYLPFFADPATASFATDIKTRLERKGIENRRLDLLAVVSLVLQAAMLRMTRLSDEVTSLTDKVTDLTERLQAVPAPGARASFSTPITGISGPMGLGAHAFFRWFTHEVYSDVRAGRDHDIRAIRDHIMALTPETPIDVWKELGTKVAQHVMTELDRATRLEMARVDLIALFGVMGRTEPHGRRQAQAQLTQVQARLSVMAELLEDEKRLGDERLGVQLERRFSQQTATHVAGREESGEHRREASPKDPRAS